MATIRLLNHQGDVALATWDPADQLTTAQANDIFDQLVSEGNLLIRADEGTGHIGTAIREFDPQAEEIVVIRNFAGG